MQPARALTPPRAGAPPEVGGEPLSAALEDGISRLRTIGTWKRWRCLLSEGALPRRHLRRAAPG